MQKALAPCFWNAEKTFCNMMKLVSFLHHSIQATPSQCPCHFCLTLLKMKHGLLLWWWGFCFCMEVKVGKLRILKCNMSWHLPLSPNMCFILCPFVPFGLCRHSHLHTYDSHCCFSSFFSLLSGNAFFMEPFHQIHR